MSMRAARGTAFACLLALALACGGSGGGSSPTEPTPPATPLTGSWAGSLANSQGQGGPFLMVLVQGGNAINGTWKQGDANSGSLVGVVSGAGISIEFAPSNPGQVCPFRASGTWTVSRISAAWANFNCTSAITGTFTVDKR